MIEWKLETVKLSKIKSNPKNPRYIKKEQSQKLQKLIDKFGLIDKPILNADYTLIGGHQRIKILKSKKVKECECWVAKEQLTEKDTEELMIGLNLNQGDWDYDILANTYELTDLLDYGFEESKLLDLSKEIEEVEGQEKDEKKGKKSKTCPSCGHEF